MSSMQSKQRGSHCLIVHNCRIAVLRRLYKPLFPIGQSESQSKRVQGIEAVSQNVCAMTACVATQQRSDRGVSTVVRVPVFEVAVVTPLPAPVRERWEAFRALVASRSGMERSIALREASLAFGSAEEPFQTLLSRDLDDMDRRQQRLNKLQERLAAAEHNRLRKLADIQSRASLRHSTSPHETAPGPQMVDASMAQHEQEEAGRALMRARLQRVARTREARFAASHTANTRAQRALTAAAATKQQADQHAQAKRALWFAKLQGSSESAAASGAEVPAALQHRLAALRQQHSSRRLQKTWRSFAAERRTTSQLVRSFVKCGVSGIELSKYEDDVPTLAPPPHAAPAAAPAQPAAPAMVMVGLGAGGQSPRHADFEDAAAKLLAPATLRATTALLRRLEQRLSAHGLVGNDSAQMLLRRIAPKNAPHGRPLERYPPRVFLCAYMVQSHPQMVFSSVGDVEARLSASSRDMLVAFEALLDKMLSPLPPAATSPHAAAAHGAVRHSSGGMPSPLSKGMAAYRAAVKRPSLGVEVEAAVAAAPFRTLGQLLVRFDELWLEYLDQFVVWKNADAASLVTDLVGMAVKLETSMLRKVGRHADSERVRSNPDLQAMIAQVQHDHDLLADRIQRLGGEHGMAQLHEALEAARSEVFAEMSEDSSDSASEMDRSSTRSSRPSSPSGLASAPTAPTSQPQDAAASTDGEQSNQQAVTNEGMVWEMLYNPTFKLPTADAEAAWARAVGGTDANGAEDAVPDASELEGMAPEQLAALLSTRAKAIAERAFWDSIQWRFATATQGGALPSQLAPLISELGLELSGMVTDTLEAEQLAEMYAEHTVLARLSSRVGGQLAGGANITALMAMLDQIARTLLAAARPDRAAAASAAMSDMQAAMAAALAPQEGGAAVAPAALAPVVAKALRLLMTQLKLVKLDAANARLGALAGMMRESGAVAYLKGKLSTAWQLPAGSDAPTITAKLPTTAAWLSSTRATVVPSLRASLASSGLAEVADGSTTAGIAVVPTNLRTGGRTASRTPSPRTPSDDYAVADAMAAAVPALSPVFPVALGSWRGTFRAALLALIAGDTPAAASLPELLANDGERLHAAQNGLQQLLVLAGGLLIVQQLRQAAGAGWSAVEKEAARRRLMVVVADPAMRLSDLVTELTQLAGAQGASVQEAQVKNMFVTIVNPESAAFRSIRSGVCTALLAHLLHGKERLAGQREAVAAALGRIGASALADDVAALGQQLASVAAVNEAVHEELLQALLA